MGIPAYVEITEWQKKQLANEVLIENAAFVAINIPIACGAIRTLIEKLEIDRAKEKAFDGSTENFLSQLKYLACSMRRDAEELHQSLIDAGHKELVHS